MAKNKVANKINATRETPKSEIRGELHSASTQNFFEKLAHLIDFRNKDNPFLRNYGRFFIFGIVAGSAFAPLYFVPLFFISFGILFKEIAETNDKKSLLRKSFCFGFAFYFFSWRWVVEPLSFGGSRYIFLKFSALLLIPLYFAVQFVFAVWGIKKIDNFVARKLRIQNDENSKNFIALLIAFPAALTALTYFFGAIFPKIPWVLPCYICSVHEVFLQTLPLFGVYGLSFVILFLSALLGVAFLQKELREKIKYCVIFTSMSGAIVLFGILRLAQHPTKFSDCSIRLVQCNISQEDKNNTQKADENLQKYVEQSLHKNKLDLIIWPEAALPYLYREDSIYLRNLLTMPLQGNEFLINGAVRKDLKTQKIYNSIIVINSTGENITTYDKSRLVPFGEYVPCRKFLSFFSALASDVGDFDVGTTPKIQQIKGVNVLFSICYEAIFPIDSADAKKADVMINLTNDGWFAGSNVEPHQHLAIVRARAVEFGIPIVRVTNVGVSAVFDPYGRIIAEIPFQQSGYRDIMLPRK